MTNRVTGEGLLRTRISGWYYYTNIIDNERYSEFKFCF